MSYIKQNESVEFAKKNLDYNELSRLGEMGASAKKFRKKMEAARVLSERLIGAKLVAEEANENICQVNN